MVARGFVAGGTSNLCSGGCGTIFSLGVGLGPFVETPPTFGKVGTQVLNQSDWRNQRHI